MLRVYWRACAIWCAAASTALSAAPELRALLPSGGQRGTTVEVVAAGNFAKWPVQAWVDRPGLVVTAAADKGKLSVVIAPDAAPGIYQLRLHDAEGATAPRPFVVGTLSEVQEQEPNDTARKAQTLAGEAVVVNGKLGSSGDVDTFVAEVRQGQTLVAALDAHELLASPVDAALQVVAPRGNVVAFNHDQRGLDPRIEYAPPHAGPWLVRLFGFPSQPNTTIGFAGGETYVYRLTVTTGPYVDYLWPLALTRDQPSTVELVGWNLPDSLRTASVQATGETAGVADPRLAGMTTVRVEPHATLVETEPNGLDAPQTVTLPCTLSGRIGERGDLDAYQFQAGKGETLVFELESRALGFPLDGVLEVTDSAGKSLAKVDDAGSARDPVLSFAPAGDGAFRVLVTDLNRQAGPRHVYRLRCTKAAPTFDATAPAHSFVVVPGKPTEIALGVNRQHGFAEEIDFAVTGLPEFVTAEAVRSAGSGETAKAVKLVLNSRGGAYSGPIRIVAQAAGASKLARPCGAAVVGFSQPVYDLWLTATPASQ